MNIVDILEYRQPYQHIHLKKKKNLGHSKSKIICLPVKKINLLKIEKSVFNLFRAPN